MSAPTTPPGGKAATAARLLGRQAALTGAGIGACPYAVDQGGPEMMLAMNWARGYRTVTPHPEPDLGETGGEHGQPPEQEAKYNPAQPRDHRGRWINLGSRVRLNPISGGGTGTVTAARPGGRFDVRRDNGTTARGVSGEYLTVIDTPPTAAAEEAPIGASRHEGKPIAARKPVPGWDGPGELHRVTYEDGSKDWQHTPPGGEPTHYRYRSEIPREPAAEPPTPAPQQRAFSETTNPEIVRLRAELQATEHRPPTVDAPPPEPAAPDAAPPTKAPTPGASELALRLRTVEQTARGGVARYIVARARDRQYRPDQSVYADAFDVAEKSIAFAAKRAVEDAYGYTRVDPMRRAAAEAAVEAALRRVAYDTATAARAKIAALDTKDAIRAWGRENVVGGPSPDFSTVAEELAAELQRIHQEPPSLHAGIDALPRQDRPDPGDDPVKQVAELKEDAYETNPSHGLPGFNNNCVHVVNAHELRRRGYATTATPLQEILRPHGGRNAQRALDRWRNPDGTPHGRSVAANYTWAEVEKVLAAWPEGARGWLRVNWTGGRSGHIFNVEKMNGEVRYVEAQTGQLQAGMTGYRERAAYGRAWGAVRVDDLEPTNTVLEFVNERG